MTKVNFFKNNLTILATVVACFSFLTLGVLTAQAEENITSPETASTEVKTTGDDSAVRNALLEKIQLLKAKLAENKAAREELKEAVKDRIEENKEERKEEMKINKEEFFATLVNLPENERKEAMMKFIANLKAVIAQKKAEHAEKIEAMKLEKKTDMGEFRSSLEGMTKEQKLNALLERVKAVREQIANRKETVDEKKNDVITETSTSVTENEVESNTSTSTTTTANSISESTEVNP